MIYFGRRISAAIFMLFTNREEIFLKLFKKAVPLISIVFALAIELILKNNDKQPAANRPYFTYFLVVVFAVIALLFVLSFANKKIDEKLSYKGEFWAGVILFLNIYNILTLKLAALPILYFPSIHRIFGVLFEDYAFLGKCLLYSLRLLLSGWFGGAIIGVATGICIGFNSKFRYWIQPIVRILGPIPSTAWIPLVLISFPTVVSASAFLIGLAVWFPTTVLTSSGIANVKNSYFEVSQTLGAGTFYRIFKVGVPAAMPHMFIGLFNGTSASFITLVTAEMIGAKYGIGWYINWQKEMMSYSNVYAGLIVMAVTCYLSITILFRVRDRLLVWQKGVIKW